MKIQKLKVRHLESHAVKCRQVVSSLALCWLREPSGTTGLEVDKGEVVC